MLIEGGYIKPEASFPCFSQQGLSGLKSHAGINYSTLRRKCAPLSYRKILFAGFHQLSR